MLLLGWMFTLHFVSDFLLQSREMGKNKSKDFDVLLFHLAIGFTLMYLGLIPFLDPTRVMLVVLINTIVHGLVDWNIWNVYKWSVQRRLTAKYADNPDALALHARTWEYWEDRAFYDTIGFDQLLHGLTLIVLYGTLIE